MYNCNNIKKGGLNLDGNISDQEPAEVWFSGIGQDFQSAKEFLTIIRTKIIGGIENGNRTSLFGKMA